MSDAELPERIYTHPTSAEWHPNRWPLEQAEYTEYVRADLVSSAVVPQGEILCACRTFNVGPARAYLDCCDFLHTTVACPNAKYPPWQPDPRHWEPIASAPALSEDGANSPILAFDAWLTRYVADNGRKLTQTEYGIAYTAFIAAHPGEGPHAHVMDSEDGVVAQQVYVSERPLRLICNKCGLKQVISLQCPREDGQLVSDMDGVVASVLNEVDCRADAVVDAAVAWHESGQEGGDGWFEASERLTQAIDALLAIKATPATHVAPSAGPEELK